LRKETNIGDVLPWEDITDEAERLLVISKGGQNAVKEGNDDEELENDKEVVRDGTDPYNERGQLWEERNKAQEHRVRRGQGQMLGHGR
jgi:hypothetical protein